MLLRKCAGGLVFDGTRIFLLKNDKGEWVLPKGVIRDGREPESLAVERVQIECGVDAEVLSKAGATSYEFYSTSRKRPVCNEITWYLMRARDSKFAVSKEEGFQDGGFFAIDEAVERITYSQDKSLLRMAADKYRQIDPMI